MSHHDLWLPNDGRNDSFSLKPMPDMAKYVKDAMVEAYANRGSVEGETVVELYALDKISGKGWHYWTSTLIRRARPATGRCEKSKAGENQPWMIRNGWGFTIGTSGTYGLSY
jgi:hypothetical protein